ncbi:MAG: CopG family ribbon-helix-helix protein [Oligoflexus sp.]
MSKQVTVKLDDQLLDSLNRWMELNQETNRSQVLIKALKKYISTPQTLEPVVVEDATMSDLEEHLPSLMEEHKEAMDLLK